MDAVNKIFPELSSPKKVVITMHQKPDGDAMGSTLGLYHFLLQFGHHITVISPTNWASFLDWMPASKSVLDYEKETKKSDELINQADWIYCLDFNTMSRTKKMEEVLLKSNATKILIDHHQQPQTEVFHFGISDTSKSSTAEMVYDFINASGHNDKINEDIAKCLYAGVMTDTGSFRFPSTSASVHAMVADLISKGLKPVSYTHLRAHETG
jgi:phosphoesterase RecJ-like protein